MNKKNIYRSKKFGIIYSVKEFTTIRGEKSFGVFSNVDDSYRHTNNFGIPTSPDFNRVQEALDDFARKQIDMGYWEICQIFI